VLLEPARIEVVLKAVPWPWTGARKRRNDETLSLEAALPRHLPRDVEEDLEQALPLTNEAGRLLARADISPMTPAPRKAPTRLHHGCCELVGDCSGRVKSGFLTAGSSHHRRAMIDNATFFSPA
jgi:hypothetical protein